MYFERGVREGGMEERRSNQTRSSSEPGIKLTHVVPVEPTVTLIRVRLYESLKVFIVVQEGMAGWGRELVDEERTAWVDDIRK